MPEEDDLSGDDDFDGYIDGESEGEGDDGDDGNGNDGGATSSDDSEDGGDGQDGDNGADGDVAIPEYLGHPGCTQDMANKDPIDFFQLFVTDAMLETVVEQTNLFAQQFIDSHDLARRSRVQQWERSPHDLVELKKFLAMTIIMGLINYPCTEDCWITSWPFATITFSSILKRDRFSLIMKFLHLNNSTKYVPKGQPGYNALYKLRPFLNPLIANFKAGFTLGQEVSVDEAIIGFKGRLWFIQYMPKKTTKWGMKAFVLADSVTGYTYNWRLYAGKKKRNIFVYTVMYELHVYANPTHLCFMHEYRSSLSNFVAKVMSNF